MDFGNRKTFVFYRRTPAARRWASLVVLLAFAVNAVLGPVSPALGQSVLSLPMSAVTLSSGYTPALIKGMRVYQDHPLRFDFIVDPGQSGLAGRDFEDESAKLMKYFLSALTVPETDLWVNLSPYEKDRIIPEIYGKTEMGRDMLAQDYMLKQLAASLTDPGTELGEKYWDTVGNVSADTFNSVLNRVWIVPEKAVVYAKNNVAYVVESRLKVMLDDEALSNQKDSAESRAPAREERSHQKDRSQSFATAGEEDYEKGTVPKSGRVPSLQSPTERGQAQVFRSIILPVIEKEINEGRNFAPLRQVYHSLILAAWYKRNLKESILSKVYVGQNKVDGVTFSDEMNKEMIYQSYLEAFKKGAYNYIKEEEDALTGEMVPRKYFSGGVMAADMGSVLRVTGKMGFSALRGSGSSALVAIELGRPGSSAVVPPAKAGASSGVFNLMRGSAVDGKIQEIWAGDLLKGNLNMLPVIPVNFDQFQRTIAGQAASEDPVAALNNLRPLAEYLLTKERKEPDTSFAERAEMSRRFLQINSRLFKIGEFIKDVENAKEEKAKNLKLLEDAIRQNLSLDYIRVLRTMVIASDKMLVGSERKLSESSEEESQLRSELAELAPKVQRERFVSKMPYFLSGNIHGKNDTRELLETTVMLAKDLTFEEFEGLMQGAKARAEHVLGFLARDSQDVLNMDDLKVNFVINAGDVFALRDAADASKVLEVDLMSFLQEPNQAQIVMWGYEFLNILAREQRIEAIKNFGRTMNNDFINHQNRAAAVAEVIRILILMTRDVDPMDDAQREQFLSDLQADTHYRDLVILLRELSEKVSVVQRYDGKNFKTVKTAQSFERVEAVLRYIGSRGQLAADSEIKPGSFKRDDIVLISELYGNARASRWFLPSFVEYKESIFDIPVPALARENKIVTGDIRESVKIGEDSVLEDEMSGDSVADWFVEKYHAAKDALSERVKVRRWVLAGAVAVMGFFAVRNLGQNEISERMNDGSQAEEVDKKVSGRLAELTRNIAELRKLQENVDALKRPGVPGSETAGEREGQAEVDKIVEPGIYIVREGDHLSKIAVMFGMRPVSGALAIAAENHIANPDLIIEGQVLRIPGTTTVTMTLGENDSSIKKIIERLYGVATKATLENFRRNNPNIRSNNDLEPGMSVRAVVPVKRNPNSGEVMRAAPGKKVSDARAGSSNVGGINLDPAGLEIKMLGDDFKFDVPIDPRVLLDLQREPVNGFVPVILNIVPIYNLPQFLGAEISAEPSDPLAFAR